MAGLSGVWRNTGAILIGVSMSVGLALPVFAQGQTPARSAPASPAQTDPAYDAARLAFEALPDMDRRIVQEALVWTGDYNGVTAGTFGRRTYDGLRGFQKRRNAPLTGILDDAQRAALIVDGRKARESVRFAIIDDPVTRARIGFPARVAETAERTSRDGMTRVARASNDKALALDVFSTLSNATPLDLLFERENELRPDLRVTYKLLRPDFYVVASEFRGRSFFTRVAQQGNDIRGFTFSYPTARKADFERVALAVANSFDPFPTTALASLGGLAGTAAPAAPPISGIAATTRMPEPAGPVPIGTALVVKSGLAIAAASVADRCKTLAVGPALEPVKGVTFDRTNGLALIEIAPALGRPVTLTGRDQPLAAEDSLIALSFASGPAGSTLVVSQAEVLAGSRVLAGLQQGAEGAVLIDRTGRLAGMVTQAASVPARVRQASAGAVMLPALSHFFAPGAAIATHFGPATPIASDARITAGLAVARVGPSVLPLFCRP